MNKIHKILMMLSVSIIVTLFVGLFKKSYFTYVYKITYPNELIAFINIKDSIVPEIEKKHYVDNVISRNVRRGKIIIFKSFASNADENRKYTNLLKSDINEINILIDNFLIELNGRSDNTYRTVDQNSQLLTLENIINKKQYLRIDNVIINKTFKKFELSDNKFEEDPSKINYNLRYFYLISIFILTFILTYILINIKRIILIIKKL